MKTKYILAALILANAALPVTAHANRGYNPGNCAVYADMAAKTVKADARITGSTKTDMIQALDTYSDHLDGVVEAGMDKTYAESAAWGWDKAKVDQMMVDGEKAIRAGFHTSTMEKDKVYTDHLLALENCAKQSAMAGDLSRDDANTMGGLLGDVFNMIR